MCMCYSIYLWVFLFVCLFVYLFVCLFVCPELFDYEGVELGSQFFGGYVCLSVCPELLVMKGIFLSLMGTPEGVK